MDKVTTFFLTFGWLIAVLLLVVLFLSTSRILEPSSMCEIEQGYSCRNVALTPNGLEIDFYNELDNVVTFNSIKISGKEIECLSTTTTIPAKIFTKVIFTCTRTDALKYDADMLISTDNSKIVLGKLSVR